MSGFFKKCQKYGIGYAVDTIFSRLHVCESKRDFILQTYYQNLIEKGVSYIIPELKDTYKKTFGKELNLDAPVTYNEKIQWLKLFDTPENNAVKCRLADKYLVREYVKEKIGEAYLVPLLGVWDRFDDIDLEKLPDRFVLKCNHGCAMNYIVKNKHDVDWKHVGFLFNKWMRINYAYNSNFELHYENIKPRIIAEQFLENNGGDLYDYKVWCFNGRAYYIQFFSGRSNKEARNSFYDRNWNMQPFAHVFPMHSNPIDCPSCLDELINVAEVLSSGFNHVRVDLYSLPNGEIKLGEMTFSPVSGLMHWEPEEPNYIFGEMLDLHYSAPSV